MAVRRATIDGMLADVVATGKSWDPAATFVQPVTAGPTGDVGLLASYTIPAAAAYAPVAITTWGALQHLADARSARSSPAITFVPGSGADAIAVIGVILVDSATPTLVKEFVEFPVAINLTGTDTPLTCVIRLCMAENASFDASIFIDG